MCAGMIYNLWRKLTEDKEDILASREKSLASLGIILSTYTKLQLNLEYRISYQKRTFHPASKIWRRVGIHSPNLLISLLDL
jgi:hypothetical protein